MLTSDLLRMRRKGAFIVPRYLRGKVLTRLQPVAEALVKSLDDAVGQKRDHVMSALDAVDHTAGDRIVVQGLRKLLLDRCTFDIAGGAEPLDIRRAVFETATAMRRELAAGERFDRDSVLAAAASSLGHDVADIELRLFADLRQNLLLTEVKAIDPKALLDRYNLALAQGALLRASKVSIALDKERPGVVRQLFRAARFHGLLHRVEQRADDQWLIELDGPMSLFTASQKYGLKLALFLPDLLRCRRWRLRAELLWGKRKEEALFELGPNDKLSAPRRGVSGVAPQIDKLIEGFRKLGSEWEVRVNDEIIALPGEVACVPDLLFTNTTTGEEVFLEAFGFWSRQAVWQRVETISSKTFPSRIILAISKKPPRQRRGARR